MKCNKLQWRCCSTGSASDGRSKYLRVLSGRRKNIGSLELAWRSRLASKSLECALCFDIPVLAQVQFLARTTSNFLRGSGTLDV